MIQNSMNKCKQMFQEVCEIDGIKEPGGSSNLLPLELCKFGLNMGRVDKSTL